MDRMETTGERPSFRVLLVDDDEDEAVLLTNALRNAEEGH